MLCSMPASIPKKKNAEKQVFKPTRLPKFLSLRCSNIESDFKNTIQQREALNWHPNYKRSNLDNETHQGIKNIMSISKMINKIAITQNFISKVCLVSSYGSNPHS